MKTVAITGIQVDLFRLKALRSALYLECRGMRRSGRSAYSIVKSELGLKGSKEKVLQQLDQMLLESSKQAVA